MLRVEMEKVEVSEKLDSLLKDHEARLTSVYNSHRQQTDRLQWEIDAKLEELREAQTAMHRWRTQWEDEMTEKNSVAAELLTLRSEFEKSSGTYDKEIEGLKDLLDKERQRADSQRQLWDTRVSEKNDMKA